MDLEKAFLELYEIQNQRMQRSQDFLEQKVFELTGQINEIIQKALLEDEENLSNVRSLMKEKRKLLAQRLDYANALNCDLLIQQREIARSERKFERCDEIRNLLDLNLIFVFDTKHGQEIHYLTPKYFKRKPLKMSDRSYVESCINNDRRFEKLFEAWLYSTQKSK